jgi:hypothetical protein
MASVQVAYEPFVVVNYRLGSRDFQLLRSWSDVEKERVDFDDEKVNHTLA